MEQPPDLRAQSGGYDYGRNTGPIRANPTFRHESIESCRNSDNWHFRSIKCGPQLIRYAHAGDVRRFRQNRSRFLRGSLNQPGDITLFESPLQEATSRSGTALTGLILVRPRRQTPTQP